MPSAPQRYRLIYLVCFLILISTTSAAEKKNIILIMADDSAVDNYGCYGSTFFFTPRLDALAASGARFNNKYYPKFTKAAEKHGQGIRGNEIVWVQNQHYKLYRDGSLYATSDRHETKSILPGTGSNEAEATRMLLQGALDSMPKIAAKLMVTDP